MFSTLLVPVQTSFGQVPIFCECVISQDDKISLLETSLPVKRHP